MVCISCTSSFEVVYHVLIRGGAKANDSIAVSFGFECRCESHSIEYNSLWVTIVDSRLDGDSPSHQRYVHDQVSYRLWIENYRTQISGQQIPLRNNKWVDISGSGCQLDPASKLNDGKAGDEGSEESTKTCQANGQEHQDSPRQVWGGVVRQFSVNPWRSAVAKKKAICTRSKMNIRHKKIIIDKNGKAYFDNFLPCFKLSWRGQKRGGS